MALVLTPATASAGNMISRAACAPKRLSVSVASPAAKSNGSRPASLVRARPLGGLLRGRTSGAISRPTTHRARRSYRMNDIASSVPLKNPPMLEVRDLQKYYASPRKIFGKARPVVQAVDGVSFDLERGETLALVGESGCGKTTTAKSVLRLIEPTGGSIKLDGTELRSLDSEQMRQQRRHLQIIFQDPYASLNPRLRAGEIVAEPMRNFAETGDNAAQQRERLAWLFAKVALDVSVQAQVINLLTDLQMEFGLSYLFVAHDLAVVRHISHRVAVMYLGHIVEIADRDTLFSAPLHPYTEILLSAVPVPNPRTPARRMLLQGDPPSPANPPSGCRFHTRCPMAHPVCKAKVPELSERPPPPHGGHCV
eukprot:gene43455-57844_t